jgi:hypothetical protein
LSLKIGEEWQSIAERLIEKFNVAFSHIEIDKVLFLSENEKKPKKYADIKFIGYPFNFITEYKYVIVFYENNTQVMTDAQRVMLVFHELLQIDYSFDKIRKYNIKDFRELISFAGVNWDIDPNLPNILDDDIDGPI